VSPFAWLRKSPSPPGPAIAADELRACRLTIGSRSLPSAIAGARTSPSVTTGVVQPRRLGTCLLSRGSARGTFRGGPPATDAPRPVSNDRLTSCLAGSSGGARLSVRRCCASVFAGGRGPHCGRLRPSIAQENARTTRHSSLARRREPRRTAIRLSSRRSMWRGVGRVCAPIVSRAGYDEPLASAAASRPGSRRLIRAR
jgi:hypothetical protein